jgi:uncharacterized membrane protein
MATEDVARQGELSRVEAFSDGVIAIVITIMVLELKVPEQIGMAALLRQGPIFLAYLLSFIYVAIYWVNHHRLFTHALRVTNGLLWSNMALLFALSLTPFATAYLGEHHFAPFAATLYLATLALPSFAYLAMQASIERQSGQRPACRSYLAATRRKGYVSTVLYLAGLGASLASPALALGVAIVVALLWILPDSPIDRLFGHGTSGDKVNRG